MQQKSQAVNGKLQMRPQRNAPQKLKVKDKQTVTFGPIHRPLIQVAWEVTGSDSSIETAAHGESVMTLQPSI